MNPIIHFELPSDEKSKVFYKEIFGWEYDEHPEMNYTIVRTSEVDEKFQPKVPGAVNGGMMSVEDNGGVNPVLVISVPSCTEYVEKVKAGGAKIVMPVTKVGDMGLYARFIDPAGVVMGIWENITK